MKRCLVAITVCSFQTHGDDRFFVLYADDTVPLESLTDIPVEP